MEISRLNTITVKSQCNFSQKLKSKTYTEAQKISNSREVYITGLEDLLQNNSNQNSKAPAKNSPIIYETQAYALAVG